MAEQLKSMAAIKREAQLDSFWETTRLSPVTGEPTETLRRKIVYKQTNAVRFCDDSWMYLESASHFQCHGDHFYLMLGDRRVAMYKKIS